MKQRCDGCDKLRSDVKSVGKDGNGEPDAPDLCFICRKEGARGRRWSNEAGGYCSVHLDDQDIRVVVILNGTNWLGHPK